MQDDPLWIDVTALMQAGTAGLGSFVAKLSAAPEQVAAVCRFHLDQSLLSVRRVARNVIPSTIAVLL